MKFHVLCGMPRSGSTMLASLLNQNPRFHASSTSALPYVMESISVRLSNTPEVKSDLAADREAAEARLVRASRAYLHAWYDDVAPVVFDKARSWSTSALLLEQLVPDAKMIVLVRDPRAVFASIERQHARFPLLDVAQTPVERTVYDRASKLFAPEGIIGQCIVGVEDLLRRRLPSLVLVHYEHLVAEPEMVLRRIYQEIGEEYYAHDFVNIKNTATDLDVMYFNKFPHDGSGPVEVREDYWRE